MTLGSSQPRPVVNKFSGCLRAAKKEPNSGNLAQVNVAGRLTALRSAAGLIPGFTFILFFFRPALGSCVPCHVQLANRSRASSPNQPLPPATLLPTAVHASHTDPP